MLFEGNSTAATATISSHGGTISFHGEATADGATIESYTSTQTGRLDFYDSASAGTASIVNYNLSSISFAGNSTADQATIVNYDGAKRPAFLDSPFATERGNYSEETALKIDAEVKRILGEAHETARRVLRERRATLDALSERLLVKEVVEAEELKTIMGSVPPRDPDGTVPLPIPDAGERAQWLAEMSRRLHRRIPNEAYRTELLTTIHYEATRAGLDPQMVLGLIQVESNFRKYAISSAGARGYMQVMPFWIKVIGRADDNLFHMRTNLRYGCNILRHYLDIEKGDLFRALGRYNGSLGKPHYPNLVRAAWEKQWAWAPQQLAAATQARPYAAGTASR